MDVEHPLPNPKRIECTQTVISQERSEADRCLYEYFHFIIPLLFYFPFLISLLLIGRNWITIDI